MSEKPPTLRRKLFLAGKTVKAVKRSGYNNAGKFPYTEAEDVFAEASRVLEKQGILILPSIESAEFKMGRTGVLAIAEIKFEVCDTKTDETLALKWKGTGFDYPGDKALYQAQTGAKKYFLQFLLDIRVDDEDDPEYDGPPVASTTDQLRAEQDRAAEQPDIPSGQDPDQGQASIPPQGEVASEAPVSGQVPAEGIESEIPADSEGLS